MKQFLKPLQYIASPIGRVLIAVLFIMTGFSKIAGYAGTQGYMELMGVPGGLLPLVILLEIGGGVLLLVGYQTRLIAVLLGGFALISGVLFHLIPGAGLEGLAAQNEQIHFLKNLGLAGGLAFVFANGPGAFSVDNRIANVV